ncbi:MAG TPA: ATP-dependent DNA helicase RecG [Tepidisphaeraceae bacterium]|jgi:ATP-dependent DNA helicase RecG|nr:ATP-dependent DNA helicase RecG [Tepidisphaeraceae bacterium]
MTGAAALAPTSSALLRPIESVPLVGSTRAKVFHALGVKTLGDLLEYFPRDYQFESSELPISQLIDNQIQTVRGEVVAVDYIPSRPRPRFEATLDDGTEKLSLTWFHGAYLRGRIHPGMTVRVQGKVSFFRNIAKMVQAKWEVVDGDTARIEESKFRPIYPASLRLPSEMIQKIVEQNLGDALAEVEEWFYPALLAKRGVLPRREAYRAIHLPRDLNEAMRARRRIIYDELMLMQVGLGISKRLREGRITAPVMRLDKLLDGRIRARFPFALTAAQQNAVWEIARDLGSGKPMNRLLQGDVGSGKTVVALYAMLTGVANRLQAVLLAPTEVLAEQHYLTLNNLLAGSNVSIGLFTGRTKRQKKATGLKDLASGKLHLAVGTQALIQEDVEFANLGLVVVDEQHKLGVRQRAVLKSKGLAPHYLVMTATPIPRTLALSFFADFDVSVIDALPPGRQPIQTRWLRTGQADTAYAFIRKEVQAGRQAYIVLPQIDDNGLEDSRSVLKEHDRLAKGPLAGLKLAALHGQMKTEEKQEIMTAFRDRQTDVLIATTVIEVGIDVPNATVIVIDNAERFGLSQLHQLRGRVGRGSESSYCLLISDPPNEHTEARLRAMTQTTDGFEIAEMDLKLRGPGEFFGTRQHGLPEFKLADVTNEMELLHQAKEDAMALLTEDPRLTHPAHRHLRMALSKQLGDSLALAQIG